MVTIEDQGLSYVQYRCDGSAVNFMLTFPYLRQQDITVFLNGVIVSEDDWSWLNEGEIQMDTAPALDDLLTIKRTTEQSERLVDFQDGGQVSEETLDLDSNQLFYLSQEAIDTTNFNLAIDSTNATIDARGNKIINVGDPTDAGDAVNLSTMEDAIEVVDDKADAAVTTANAAQTTANAAEATANAIAGTANTALTNANAAVAAAAAAQSTADSAVATANAIEALAQQGVDDASAAQADADAAQATADSAVIDAANAQADAITAQNDAAAAQSDVDALESLFTAHEGSSEDTHGTLGAIVGEDNTQTLTNKTLTSPVLNSPSIVTPSRSDVKQDTKANLDTYALTATNGQMCFATDLKQMYQVVDGLLSSVGGSTGTLNTITQLTGDEGVGNWSTGDNSTFLGGGTISGTFVKNTTAPFQGLSDFKYTQAAGSLNDYMACPAFTVDPRFRGKTNTLVMMNTYDGSDNDIEVIFYDVTNAAIIPSSVFIKANSSVNILRTNITIPSTCASMRIGFMTRVLNSGKIFRFDSIELTADTTIMAPLMNLQAQTSVTVTGQWTTNVTYAATKRIIGEFAEYKVKWTCSNTPTGATQVINLPTGDVIDSTKLKLTAPNNYGMLISSGMAWDNSGAIGHPLYCEYQGNTGQVAVMVGSASGTYLGRAGLSTTVPFSSAASDDYEVTFQVPLVGLVANNTNILTSPDTFNSDTANFVYAGSSTYTPSTLPNAPIGTFITKTFTASTVNTSTQTNAAAPTQTSASMNASGILLTGRVYSGTGTTALPPYFAIQIGKGHLGVSLRGYQTANKGGADTGLSPFREGTNAQYGLIVDGYSCYNPTTGVLVLDAGTLMATTITTRGFWNNTGNVTTDVYITINASKNPALTGLNIYSQDVAVITNEYTSGGNGQSSATSFTARQMNTLIDPSGIVKNPTSFTGAGGTNTSITLDAGTYNIEGYSCGYHSSASVPTLTMKARFYNVTAGASVVTGLGSYGVYNNAQNTALMLHVPISGTFTITTQSTFEFQHICTVAIAAGMGAGLSLGGNEVHGALRIHKLR